MARTDFTRIRFFGVAAYEIVTRDGVHILMDPFLDQNPGSPVKSHELDKVDLIDFKDVKLLQNFIPERGKILPRRISGVCTAHQRMLTEAIKRARNIALLPYTAD